MKLTQIIAVAALAAATLPAWAQNQDTAATEDAATKRSLPARTPTNAELYEIIQAQQEEIDRLVGAREGISAEGRTRIGGYGELHYNNLDSKKEIDFHRFVLFFNHEFNEDTRFYSELEVEHSLTGEGKPGEVELEQAYVEFDLSDQTVVKGGLFLVPVGILNETHEPPTFYGVERNPIESNLVPSTWWEAGAALSGRNASGFSYDIALHSGLDIDPADYNIRSGRQKVAKAGAEELAVSGRIKYTGIAGLELAASVVSQGDVTQDPAIDGGAGTLLESHAVWNTGPFTLKALYANWKFDGAAAEALDRDTQDGYFVEGAYKLTPAFGIFTRYNEYDTGGLGDTAVSQVDVGFNWWPHRNVVVKFDIQNQSKAGNDDGFNVGIGYQF